MLNFPSNHVVWKFNTYPNVNHGKNVSLWLPNYSLWVVDWMTIEWESQRDINKSADVFLIIPYIFLLHTSDGGPEIGSSTSCQGYFHVPPNLNPGYLVLYYSYFPAHISEIKWNYIL